jgi:PadR family transcriptional regulator PadR
MPRVANTSPQTRSLLGALAAKPQSWRHGYELSKLTGLKSGTLYPLLMRLEAQGMLASRWGAPRGPGRPPRHMYRLTRAGLALAREREAVRTAAGPAGRLVETPV